MPPRWHNNIKSWIVSVSWSPIKCNLCNFGCQSSLYIILQPITATMGNNSTARPALLACINSERIILLVLLCYSVVVVTSLGVVKTFLPSHRQSLQTSLTSSLQPSWWGSCDASNLPYDSAFRVLVKYHEKYGDLVIPRRFIVPATSEWPKEWHGVKLARHVYNRKWWTKHIAKNNDRVSQLNNIGFVWERLQPEWNLFMEAMVTYRSIYGDVMVPATFVVPRDNDEWSKGCWDLPLGNVVHRLRLRHDFLTGDTALERKNQLDGLGFVWDVSEYNFKKFLTALRIFSKLEQEENEHTIMASTIRVPSKFVVPSDDYRWPIILWNYRLGEKCEFISVSFFFSCHLL